MATREALLVARTRQPEPREGQAGPAGWRVKEEFICAIRGEEEIVLTDYATGVKCIEFTAAVHPSAATGQMVSVD